MYDGLPSYRRSAAARFIDAKLQIGIVAFSLAELCSETGLSIIAAKRQLKRMRDAVVQVAPRQDFYLAVQPEYRATGAPPVSWWLDAYFNWLGRPYYVALQSAAAEHGSRHQAVMLVQVITDHHRRDIELGRTRVRFYRKAEAIITPTEPASGAHSLLKISSPEATAIDLIKYAGRIGGIERAIETLKPLIPKFQAKQLVQAIQAGHEAAATQRLGYILERLGETRLAKTVESQLPERPFRVLLNVHSEPSEDSPYSPRWHVIGNASFEGIQ